MMHFVSIFIKNFYKSRLQISQITFSYIRPIYDKVKCIFILSAGYEGQNNQQPGSANGGDGTSSLDCLSLIVESISPGTAVVAGLLQGQARPMVRLHGASKHEELGDHVDHTVPIVKMSQQ
jgi:hypothetical protein